MGHGGCHNFQRRTQFTRAGTCQDQQIPRNYKQILRRSGRPGNLLRKPGQYPSPLSLDHLRMKKGGKLQGSKRFDLGESYLKKTRALNGDAQVIMN